MIRVDTLVTDVPVFVESRVWQYEGERYGCVVVHVDPDDDNVDFTPANARALARELIKAANEADLALGARLSAGAR